MSVCANFGNMLQTKGRCVASALDLPDHSRVRAGDLLPELGRVKPGHFSVFVPSAAAFAPGDLVRVTVNGKDKTGKHDLNNGSLHTIAAVAPGGDITLSNGWTVDTPHLTHGYVSTSYGAQGKTVDVCLAAMGRESLPAVNAAQFYVTASRARHQFRLYTDVPPEELKAAIRRQDVRKSATETFRPKRKRRNPHVEIRKRAQAMVRRRLLEQQIDAMAPVIARKQLERSVDFGW